MWKLQKRPFRFIRYANAEQALAKYSGTLRILFPFIFYDQIPDSAH